MNEQKLITHLESLRNIHPDKDWVILTRNNLLGTQKAESKVKLWTLDPKFNFGFFNFVVPKPLAVSVMAALVVLIGGITIVQDGGLPFRSSEGAKEGGFVASVRHKSLSVETKDELKQIADDVRGRIPSGGTTPTTTGDESALTVVFNEDSDEQEKFKEALREKIEAKIDKINDLFAQLEDEDLAREISLNLRRYEENFKLADSKLAEQIRSLLEDSQRALDEGDLIKALDLVIAIDKLLK